MDDNNQALNNQATEAASPAPSEETKVPVTNVEEQVQETSTEASQSSSTQTEESEGSRKSAQNRIRELSTESKAKDSTIRSLEEQLAELTGSVDSQRQTPQYNPQVQPGQEITPEQYQNDVASRADAIVNLRLQQERILSRINSEANESVRAHPQLDPKSDLFDKDLSESITQATLAYARVNPTGSVKKFVDGLMKPYEKSLEMHKGQAETEIAKEQARAALRPSAAVTSEKKAEDMSIAELEKKLGVIQS